MERLDENKDLYFGMGKNTFLMVMHLSQLLGMVAVGFGFIVPIVLWIIRKDADADVDRHGKNITNFIISWVIYYAIAGILSLILIGVVLLIVLGICQLIFTIMAAVKANNGEYWEYPFTIKLIK